MAQQTLKNRKRNGTTSLREDGRQQNRGTLPRMLYVFYNYMFNDQVPAPQPKNEAKSGVPAPKILTKGQKKKQKQEALQRKKEEEERRAQVSAEELRRQKEEDLKHSKMSGTGLGTGRSNLKITKMHLTFLEAREDQQRQSP
jgi:hypothetical protein